MLRRALTVTVLLLLTAVGVAVTDLWSVQRDYFVERPGIPAGVRVSDSRSRDGIGLSETVDIESSTGLAVSMRTLRPLDSGGTKLPLLLLIGGHRTGKNAVELVGDARDVAYAAIDYPYRGSHSLHGLGEIVTAVPDLRQAFLDTPPALSLAVQWLLEQDWVDRERVELVGISLGVPFAAVAGALDERFSRVWLIHGGADNQAWVEYAARGRIENEALRRAMVRAALFVSYGNSFDTRRWITEIAPRPLIVIAARDDDRVPAAAQTPFVEAAADNAAELIWTEGLHIGPSRQFELGQLLEIVLDRVRNRS